MALLELENLEDLRKMEGQPFPPSPWMTLTQEQIDDFARATGDFQWIHVDPDRAARESPFKKPVAHGFLSLSLISRMLGECIRVRPARMGVNYGLNKVRFPSPVPVGSRLRLTGRIQQVEDYGAGGVRITWACTLEMEGSEKPACVAEFISLMLV